MKQVETCFLIIVSGNFIENQTSVMRLVLGTLLFGFDKCVVEDVDENVDEGLDIMGWWAQFALRQPLL